MSFPRIRIIGGGLAGCEAALQLAAKGFDVDLYEMRGGNNSTPAHKTSHLAELVCSNSFKGLGMASAHGLLKNELRLLGSFLMQAAEVARVPAGESLTVDRERFSAEIERLITNNPRIILHREEVTELADARPTLIAAGPLCSDALAGDLFQRLGSRKLHFCDAIAPVVDVDSIDMEHAFALNRWEKGETADFINCPLDKPTYDEFVRRLQEADAIEPKPFEKNELFEGCLPIEEMARRGAETLRFGPMRPVGLGFDANGKKWHAVIQLRTENAQKTLYNLVGFQTRLKWGTQKEIFSLIPALRNANFVRLGTMHRNTFIESPLLLDNTLHLKGTLPGENTSANQDFTGLPPIWFAGQITGAEGYTEAVATGWYAAWHMAQRLTRNTEIPLPAGSCMRALVDHLVSPNPDFQPMNFNFGLLPREGKLRKGQKKEFLAEQAQHAMQAWIAEHRVTGPYHKDLGL